MIKSYLFIEKGPLEEKVFPLEARESIGRGMENHICLSHPTVSKKHAVYYVEDGRSIVEDIGSSNGTFVNGERIKKSILSSGDTLVVGSVPLRFFQGEEARELIHLMEASELNESDISTCLNSGDLSNRSRRLIHAISKVPFFAGLGEKDLARLSQVANLVLFDPDSIIIRQGDLGRSLYIILDGRVQVITYDNQGREILVSFLTGNQYFGEISFLTGVPRMVTVQVLEETLLCKLRLECMREVMNNSPAVREVIEECCRESLKDLEEKKRAAGFTERRKQPRFNIELPVDFHFPSSSDIPDEFEGTLFHAISNKISVSGIRIHARDHRLLDLLINSKIRLTINLPQSKGIIHCSGTLKRVAEKKGEVSSIFLGIEFAEISQDHREKLENFLSE
ncbi:MAG: cyclic nucleotide-binding domain-containing protein [Desulfobacterales bacterium]|jgi:CRP-like cAMP-binding protein